MKTQEIKINSSTLWVDYQKLLQTYDNAVERQSEMISKHYEFMKLLEDKNFENKVLAQENRVLADRLLEIESELIKLKQKKKQRPSFLVTLKKKFPYNRE